MQLEAIQQGSVHMEKDRGTLAALQAQMSVMKEQLNVVLAYHTRAERAGPPPGLEQPQGSGDSFSGAVATLVGTFEAQGSKQASEGSSSGRSTARLAS